MSADLSLSDKVRVFKGELVGAIGVINSFENDQVVFKPTNLDGFTDNLQIKREYLERHFDVNDQVRIVSGKYAGETALITEEAQLPVKVSSNRKIFMVKLDRSQLEVRVDRENIRLKNDQTKDIKKLIEMCQID